MNQSAAKQAYRLMKRNLVIAVAGALFILGTIVQIHAQNLVQSLSVNLIAYNTASNRVFTIGTQQLIRYLWGTNVPNGHLYLVTPTGNAPGTTGPLNAFLRITSGTTVLYEIPSVTQFNVYQDLVALKTNGLTITTHALNRFSIDSGSVRAELQGLSTWNISQARVNGVDLSGTGSFTAPVNGWFALYDVLSPTPVGGRIVASRPKYGP